MPERPLPFDWDVHLVGDDMFLSCSQYCRQVMGQSERKMRFDPKMEDIW